MTEVFDQEAGRSTERAPRFEQGGYSPEPSLERVYLDEPIIHLADAEDAGHPMPAPDPDPKKFATAAEHTEAYVAQKNQEYRLEQVFRNVRGSVYLSECGVSQTGIDEYLAGNKPKDASELRQLQWRFDAWTQRNFWDVILVMVALLTVAGFGIVAAHAEINEDSAFGFIAFLLGIGGMTAEVIRRGRE